MAPNPDLCREICMESVGSVVQCLPRTAVVLILIVGSDEKREEKWRQDLQEVVQPNLFKSSTYI